MAALGLSLQSIDLKRAMIRPWRCNSTVVWPVLSAVAPWPGRTLCAKKPRFATETRLASSGYNLMPPSGGDETLGVSYSKCPRRLPYQCPSFSSLRWLSKSISRAGEGRNSRDLIGARKGWNPDASETRLDLLRPQRRRYRDCQVNGGQRRATSRS